MMDARDFDFDLFFTFFPCRYAAKPIQIHLATAGGYLPPESYSGSSHAERRRLLRSTSRPVEYALNPGMGDILFEKRQLWLRARADLEQADYDFNPEAYFQDFIEYATCGCFSFDRTNVNDSNDERYHLVAYPRTERRFIAGDSSPRDVLDADEYVRRDFGTPVKFFFRGALLFVHSDSGRLLGIGRRSRHDD
jgi:hypothetical protein